MRTTLSVPQSPMPRCVAWPINHQTSNPTGVRGSVSFLGSSFCDDVHDIEEIDGQVQVENAKVLEQLINPWSLHLQDSDEVEGGAEAPRIARMAQVRYVESLATKKAGNRRDGKICRCVGGWMRQRHQSGSHRRSDN